MQIAPDAHLTYCTNIHAADGLDQVLESVAYYGSILKANLSPDAPFGIGLRLSGSESQEAMQPEGLDALRVTLEENGLYVFTMNGFPHGPFHNRVIKDDVHRPDWELPERAAYTKRLARILAHMLPEGASGGISTSPLSYKPWRGPVTRETWTTFVQHLGDVVKELVLYREHTGTLIHLDIEPEPDGLLENSSEVVAFFNEWLLPVGATLLGKALGMPAGAAEACLRDHVQICWDTCHVAVAFEKPHEVLARYRSHGIRVGKIQVSSAIKVDLNEDRREIQSSLLPFLDTTYLHQVVQRNRDGSFTSYLDLEPALEYLSDENAMEWRIHYHVPIFTDGADIIQTTQESIRETFALLREDPFTEHLEIETYTWEVLPKRLKLPLAASIEREFTWAISEYSRF